MGLIKIWPALSTDGLLVYCGNWADLCLHSHLDIPKWSFLEGFNKNEMVTSNFWEMKAIGLSVRTTSRGYHDPAVKYNWGGLHSITSW